jgi:ATP-binding cassette subfamily A (ABC1) protein 3
MTKRYHVYKRDRAGLICEVIVPFIMVFVGCALTLIVLTKDSPARYLTPSLYPSPQRILMNNSTVVDVGIGNISP